MANEACPVTCHNRWWKSWEQDLLWSCGCAGKCLGGLQRWCDILIRAFWSLDCCQVTLLAALTLQVLGPTFVFLLWTFMERHSVGCDFWAVGRVPWDGGCLQAVCSQGLVAVPFLAMRGKQSRWDPLLSWSYCMYVWQTWTDGGDCFLERKEECLLDLLT